MTVFYDSARYGLIPAGADAALYHDGRYAVTAEQASHFGRVRWITIAGGAAAAAHTGAIDWEYGNLAFEGNQLLEWAEARQAMNARARVYVDFANLPRAYSLVGHLRCVCWWLATLDNTQRTAEELAAKAQDCGVTLPLETIWAQQWRGGMTAPYDESILLGSAW